MRLSIQTKLFLSHFAAIVLVSGSVGSYFYDSAIENLTEALRSRLQNSAALISQGLYVKSLDQIQGPDDVNSLVYKQGVDSLRDFVKANPDIAFIYVMRKLDNKPVFVLDSDMVEPALPGEVYPQNVPALMEGFLRPSVDSEITTDRWGSFLSGYSPLDTGKGSYLVGIDMKADEVQSKLEKMRLAGLLSLALSILLAALFSRFLSSNFTQRIANVMRRLSSIAPADNEETLTIIGDEFENLSDAFERMSIRLGKNHKKLEENQTALKHARDELEVRVSERTSELVKANQQLLKEISERKLMEEKLETLSRTDYLTGILNRRAITQLLEEASQTNSNEQESFCIILIDLDHFKDINDQYGHDMGDLTLKHAVERLDNGIRDSDVLGRWGGEEFLIMSPQTGLEEAKHLAQRLCKNLDGSRIDSANTLITVTGSFGVTQFKPGESLDSCLKRTDDALYMAKDQGRNCVVVIPPA